MFRRLSASLGLVASLLILSIATVAHAATQVTSSTQDSSNALKISPVRTDLTINPGQSQVFDVYVQNVGSGVAHLRALVNDFVADKDESGAPSIILDPSQAAPTHSLKTFIAPVSDFDLQPQEQKDIRLTINIPKTAMAGGYYGVIRFEPASPSSGTQNVTLSGSVGSLILVKVPGAIKENMTLAGFDVRQFDTHHNEQVKSLFTSGKNIEAVVRFQNGGDVQEEPFGKILVRKSGQTLASYDINATTPRGNVLPDSVRRFAVNLQHISSFGKYTIEGSFGYGSHGQLLTASRTIYVVPISLLVTVGVAIVIVLAIIFVLPRIIKNYNRRIVNKAISKKRK